MACSRYLVGDARNTQPLLVEVQDMYTFREELSVKICAMSIGKLTSEDTMLPNRGTVRRPWKTRLRLAKSTVSSGGSGVYRARR